MTSKALVDELIQIKQENGLTQAQWAHLSGVDPSIITELETGHTSPTMAVVLALLAPLGKTIAIVPIE